MQFDLIFHRCQFAEWQEKNGLAGNYMENFYRYFVYMQEYKSDIDPNYKIPFDYKLHIVDNFKDINVTNNTFIFAPLNKDLLNYFGDNRDEFEHLYKLDENPLLELCFDYAHESILPGNFDRYKDSQTEWFKSIEWERFSVFTFATTKIDKINRNGFKNIFYGISYVVTWFSKVTANETPHIKNKDLIYTWPNKNAPIRYFCPNNQFRPGRGQLIVRMYERGMLDDCEWNMNSYTDWINHGKWQQTIKDELTDKYFEYFGTAPKRNSWPWNKEFNFSKQETYDPFRVAEFWPDSLLNKCYIYLANETFNDYRSEQDEPEPEHYVNTETTEKVMKGFVYGMPMFVNGRQGIINDCERLGFDMFRDYMVNDYDAEPDTIKRIDMMLDCAEAFPEPTAPIVQRLYDNKAHWLKKETLWNLGDTSVDGVHFFEKLLDK